MKERNRGDSQQGQKRGITIDDGARGQRWWLDGGRGGCRQLARVLAEKIVMPQRVPRCSRRRGNPWTRRWKGPRPRLITAWARSSRHGAWNEGACRMGCWRCRAAGSGVININSFGLINENIIWIWLRLKLWLPLFTLYSFHSFIIFFPLIVELLPWTALQ